MAPKRPEYQLSRADLRGVGVHLRSFRVSGAGTPSQVELERLRERFLDYLESTTVMSDIYLYHEGAIGGPTLIVDATLELDQTTYRTYLLDLVALYPLIFGVLTPWWGHVDIEVGVTVADRFDLPVTTITRTARVDFSSNILSWFRTAYVEQAYREAYDRAFRSIAEQLAVEVPRLRAAAGLDLPRPPEAVAARPVPEPEAPSEMAWPVEPGESEDLPAPAALSAPPGALEPPEPALDDDLSRVAELVPRLDFDVDYGKRQAGFGLITESPELLDGTIWGYLKMLGGVEVAGIYGLTTVSSGIQTEQGEVAIAGSAARSAGFRVSLYNAPESTGFFLYPVLGFMTQQIDIADFREELPGFVPDIPNATEIPGNCSDPATGEQVDCDEPNVYILNIHTGYGGVRAGYDLVLGSEYVKLFVSAGAGVSLVEFRSVTARVAAWESHAESWNVLRSVSVGGTAGIVLPTLHVALRFIVDYEHYLRFAYAEPLEFRGPVAFNEEKHKYMRQMFIVDNAEIGSWSFQLATAFVF